MTSARSPWLVLFLVLLLTHSLARSSSTCFLPLTPLIVTNAQRTTHTRYRYTHFNPVQTQYFHTVYVTRSLLK